MEKRRWVFDLEASGLLDHTSLDYLSVPYKLKKSFQVWCAVFTDEVTGLTVRLRPNELDKIEGLIACAESLSGHNIISYDLLVLKLYFGIDYEINEYNYKDCKVGGYKIEVVDTLILSQYLQPDRIGGHSLKAWGQRLNDDKGSYGEDTEDAWGSFSEDMLDYCEQDVALNIKVYRALMKEWGQWDHTPAFSMEQAINEIIVRQEHIGFHFNMEKAQEALDDLNSKLEAIENKVEPELPKMKLAKTKAQQYALPARQIKQNGEPTTSLENWIKKHKAKLEQDSFGDWELQAFGKTIMLPSQDREPLVTHAPMQLSDQKQMKQYLVHIGWNPTVWGQRDLTLKSGTKLKVSFDKYKEAITRYCEETAKSHFKKYRLGQVQVESVKDMYHKLLHSDITRPVYVLTSPKYTIDQDKTICPNLTKLGEKVEWISDVVLWLTYRHRRNMLKSPNETGLMSHPRISVDGRVPTGAVVTGTNTARFKHRVCVNIPRPSSVYGAEIRELFGCGEGFYQIGCDAASLEGRVQGHYCYPYTDGVELAKTLIAEKPNDIHTMRAKSLGISRDEAKAVGYAVLYGAQPAKLQSMLGCPMTEAKDLHKSFWESTPALLELKQKVEKYWEKNGKRFLKAIDGRKINTRSKHSLLNALFQSAGIILMKWAAIWLDRELDEKGFLFKPFDSDSWEGKCAEMQHYHDEYQHIVHPSLVQDKDGELRSVVGDLMEEAIAKGGEILKMRVEFAGEAMIGHNWKDCH